MTTDTKKNWWARRFGLRAALMVLGTLSLGGLLQGCFGGGGSSVCGPSAIQAEWVITGSGVPISCQTAGATTVSLMVDDVSMIADFDCGAHVGSTPSIAGGRSHNVSLVLLDGAGNVLSEVPATRVSVPCDSVLDLGTVEFSL
jgi:hypothetical protein